MFSCCGIISNFPNWISSDKYFLLRLDTFIFYKIRNVSGALASARTHTEPLGTRHRVCFNCAQFCINLSRYPLFVKISIPPFFLKHTIGSFSLATTFFDSQPNPRIPRHLISIIFLVITTWLTCSRTHWPLRQFSPRQLRRVRIVPNGWYLTYYLLSYWLSEPR